MSEQLTNAVAELKEDEALKLVNEMVEKGEDANAIFDAARKGMETVGQRFALANISFPSLYIPAKSSKQSPKSLPRL